MIFLPRPKLPGRPGVRGWILLLVAAWALPSVPAAAEDAAPAAGSWELLTAYQFSDALEWFMQAPAGANRDLGEAVSLLNHPPLTGGKLARAEALLRPLAAGGDDDAMYARYLLARIAHVHRPETDVAAAEAAYRAAIAADPAHPLAQVAAGKLAVLLLYQRPDLTVPERLAAAAGLEPVAGAARLPEAACAYYRALAGGALYYEVRDERVLAWLQRAAAIGTQDVLVTASLRIQLAEVARALGRREEAVGYYRHFLATILPTDIRGQTARERMEELEATP